MDIFLKLLITIAKKHKCELLLTIFLILIAWYALWVIFLPNNNHRNIDVKHGYKLGNGFEDVVTIVTSHNYINDGYLKTWFLPNRKFAPQVSFFSKEECNCNYDQNIKPIFHPILNEEKRDILSIKKECVYIHYPPLSDIIYSLIARLGFNQLFHFKIFSLLLNLLLLVSLYIMIKKLCSRIIALTVVIIAGTSPIYLMWINLTYYHPFQYLFLVVSIIFFMKLIEEDNKTKRKIWHIIVCIVYFCQVLVSFELVFYSMIFYSGYYFLHRNDEKAKFRYLIFIGSSALLALILHLLQVILYLGFNETINDYVRTFFLRLGDNYFQQLLTGIKVWNKQFSFYYSYLILLLPSFVIININISLTDKKYFKVNWILLIFLFASIFHTLVFLSTSVMHYFVIIPRGVFVLFMVLISYYLFYLTKIFKIKNKLYQSQSTKNYFILLMFFTVAFFSAVLYNNYSKIVMSVKYELAANEIVEKNNITYEFLDIINWKVSTNPGAMINMSYTIIDGIYPENKYNIESVLKFEYNVQQVYDYYYLRHHMAESFAILTDYDSAEYLLNDTTIEYFDGDDYTPISYTTEFKNFKRMNTTYRWVIYNFDAMLVKGFRIRSNPKKNYNLYEIKIIKPDA